MPKGYQGGKGGGKGGRSKYLPIIPKAETPDQKAQFDKQFQALQKRFQQDYGIKLSDTLRDRQDFIGIRESLYGVEAVLKEFPNAKKYFNGSEITSRDLKIGTYASANLVSGRLSLNTAYYQNYDSVRISKANDHGWSPLGSTGQSAAVHEAGHLLVKAIQNKKGGSYDAIANRIANNALKNGAVQNYLKKNNIRSNAKWRAAYQISHYASNKGSNHEIIAEAVSDYMSNRSKANVYSRAIIQELKKELK